MSESEVHLAEIYSVLQIPRIGSRFPGESVSISIQNLAPKSLDVFWLDYSGFPVKYGTIGVKKSLNIVTFVGHFWIFRQACNGTIAFCLPGNKEVFSPPRLVNHQSSNFKVSVGVYLKVDSLLNCCISCVGDICDEAEVELLPIPESLKEEVRFYTKRKKLYLKYLSRRK